VVIFQRGPLAAESQRIVASLRPSTEGRGTSANLVVESVDLSGPMEPSFRQLWHSQKDAKLPWMVVRAPGEDHEKRTIWAGALDDDAARKLLDSPARRTIARRLMKGDSIVWGLLESGDKERGVSLADIDAIETAIAQVDAKLVVVDPLMAYMGSETNSYRDQDVRGVRAPLARLAERHGVAVSIAGHLLDHDAKGGDRVGHRQGVGVREVLIPVSPGRNLSTLVETAVRVQLLRMRGYNAAERFVARYEGQLRGDDRER